MLKLEDWLNNNCDIHIQESRHDYIGYVSVGIDSNSSEADKAIDCFYMLIGEYDEFVEAEKFFNNSYGMFISYGKSVEEALLNIRKRIESALNE